MVGRIIIKIGSQGKVIADIEDDFTNFVGQSLAGGISKSRVFIDFIYLICKKGGYNTQIFRYLQQINIIHINKKIQKEGEHYFRVYQSEQFNTNNPIIINQLQSKREGEFKERVSIRIKSHSLQAMQTEKYKVSQAPTKSSTSGHYLLSTKEGEKLRSTSVTKQASQKQLLSNSQKNKSVQIRDAPFEQTLAHQNKYFVKQQLGGMDITKKSIPSSFLKGRKKQASDQDQSYNKDQDYLGSAKSRFDSKFCLPQLSDKINKFDEGDQNIHDESLTLTHRMPQKNNNNSIVHQSRQNQKSVSPDRETLYNVSNYQTNLIQSKSLQRDQKIVPQFKTKDLGNSEFINFLDQGDSSLFERGGNNNYIAKKYATNNINIQEPLSKINEQDYKNPKSRNIPTDKLKQTSAQLLQQIVHTQHQDDKGGIAIKSSATVGTDEGVKREKRSKSQYEQPPYSRRDVSPTLYRINQTSAMTNSQHRHNNQSYKTKNENSIYQNYNVEYPLSSQLASVKPKRMTYLHRSFQNRQHHLQQQKSQKQISGQINDSVVSNNILSTSIDVNKSAIKSFANSTSYQQPWQQNKNNKTKSPDINQSLDLNTTFDISMHLKQSPSSPLAQSQLKSLSHNKSSNKNLRENSQQQNQGNNRYQQGKIHSFLGNNLYQNMSHYTSNQVSARDLNLTANNLSFNDQSTTAGAAAESNINHNNPQLKFTKLNLSQNNPIQNVSNQQQDDQSSKQSFSLLSARLLQSQNNQSHSSPRSVTTTTTHHEKLIYKHIQFLIQQRDGIASASTSPNQRQNQSINVESILNNNDECSRFLRHYFNKVEVLFSSIERKDLDHIILLITNLLDVLVEMNEVNLFCQFVLLIGYMARDFNHIDKAIFFFHQVETTSNLFRLWNMKAEALIRLAECAKELKLYDSSILMLKKALQFVWIVKDHDRELAIYDSLGLNYFYQGDLENAFYYHEKYMKGEVEAEQTATKQLSIKNIEFFEMKQYRKQMKFSKLVMINLSLPIKNIFDSNEQSPTFKTKKKEKQRQTETFNQTNTAFNAMNESNYCSNQQDNQQNVIDLMKSQSGFLLVPLCDFDKITNWKNCDGKKLIQKLVSSQEYEYIVQESKNKEQTEPDQNNANPQQENSSRAEASDLIQPSKIKSTKKFIPRIQLPGILIKHNQTQNHQEFKQMLHKMRISNFNLEEKVKEMINDKTSLDQIMEKIDHNVKNHKSNAFSQQKINLNHLGEEVQSTSKKNQTDSYYLKKKYLVILSEFIGDYVFKKVF